MKNLMSIIVVLMFVMAMTCPAFATEDTFVPSISEKEGPKIVADEDGNVGVIEDEDGNVIDLVPGPCLVITPIAKVDESTMIPEDARELLKDVYEQLITGEMEIPAEKLDPDIEGDEIVIRDLVDLSWLCEEHPEMLEPEGVTLRITLDVAIDPEDLLYVMVYIDGEWQPIVEVINNGDGTVTCVFEELCPVAFIIAEDRDVPSTGMMEGDLLFWTILMVSAAAVMVVVVAFRPRERKA